MNHIPSGPCTTSWSYYSPVPINCSNKEPCILGVDEAGRGPVLGPMVYAISYCPVDQSNNLKSVGFADSKQLTAETRDSLFDKISEEREWIGWAVHVLSPQDISSSMLRREKYNLNAMAHDTTIALIKQVIEQGVNVTEVYVDTVGSPEKYQAKLSDIFPGIKIVVAKKADSTYPIVSAASICAKVTRDEILDKWEFVESDLEISRDFGSGYPSGIPLLIIDPNTVAWLKKHLHPIFGFPRLIRFSWSTTDNLLLDGGVSFDWGDNVDENQPTIDKYFGTQKVGRDAIFKSINLVNPSTF